MSAFSAHNFLTFLTADTRELVLLRDFDGRTAPQWPVQNVFYLRPGKPSVPIIMQADAKPEESLWYWFLSENYPEFLEDNKITNEQLRQIAYLILDGIYIQEISTARKFLIVDGLQSIFRNFRFIGKINSNIAIACLLESGGYVKKMFRDYYPVLKPVKLSFDPTTDYELCNESEIVYMSEYDDSEEEV